MPGTVVACHLQTTATPRSCGRLPQSSPEQSRFRGNMRTTICDRRATRGTLHSVTSFRGVISSESGAAEIARPPILAARPTTVREVGYDELWLQDWLAEDPSRLGLGDVAIMDQEQGQAAGGLLDLLAVDRENETYYSVEVQLGEIDASHTVTGCHAVEQFTAGGSGALGPLTYRIRVIAGTVLAIALATEHCALRRGGHECNCSSAGVWRQDAGDGGSSAARASWPRLCLPRQPTFCCGHLSHHPMR